MFIGPKSALFTAFDSHVCLLPHFKSIFFPIMSRIIVPSVHVPRKIRARIPIFVAGNNMYAYLASAGHIPRSSVATPPLEDGPCFGDSSSALALPAQRCGLFGPGFRQPLLKFPQRVHFRFSERGTHTCLLRSQTNFLNFPGCILDVRKRVYLHVCP